MNSSEICILLSCVSVFVATIMILANVIVNKKQKKYIESIKAGDIFVFHLDVNSYYRKIEAYLYDLTNPFDSTPIPLVFPDSTCMIKEIRKSKTGETWVSYVRIKTPDKIYTAENSDILTEHYESLNEFLEFRKRVERFEI